MTAAFAQLEEENKALREAVARRMEATPDDDPKKVGYAPMAEESETEIADSDTPAIPVDWILRGERELKAEREAPPEPRPLGEGVMHAPAADNESERLLMDAISAVRDRRATYGPPREHFAITAALVNAAFGTSFTAADWAVVMILDKVARSRGPTASRDNWTDVAGYAACRAETETP